MLQPLLIGVLTVVAATAVAAVLLLGEYARPAVDAATLVIALITLLYVLPRRAEVLVMRQDELEIPDLVFYLYPDNGLQVPGDYLLQPHVAVTNVGGSKAIVSRVRIETLLDSGRREVTLPGATANFTAQQYRARSGWRDTRYYFEHEMTSGPWLLDPGDIIMLRFRTRRGIGWSPSWIIAHLRQVHEVLATSITHARGTVSWRQGTRVRTTRFLVPVESLQQDDYTKAIRTLTADFTSMPRVTTRDIPIE